MKAVPIVDAVREGDPAVISVGVLLLLGAVGAVWLLRRRRPIQPPRGSLTVAKIQAREAANQAKRASHEHETLTAIDEANCQETSRLANVQARREQLAAAEVTQTIPAIAVDAHTESIPAPRPYPRSARRTAGERACVTP
jgi:cell division septation protein DedD